MSVQDMKRPLNLLIMVDQGEEWSEGTATLPIAVWCMHSELPELVILSVQALTRGTALMQLQSPGGKQ